MIHDEEIPELYFQWLRDEAFAAKSRRSRYEGVLRVLHDIPFYWTEWSDENRAGDALSFRQDEFLARHIDPRQDHTHARWLEEWGAAAPSVLEVLLGMARRWAFYFEGPASYYFDHMFHNLGLNTCIGRTLPSETQIAIRDTIDFWLTRQFDAYGNGSPFPIPPKFFDEPLDMVSLDIWGQMNAYSAVYFQ